MSYRCDFCHAMQYSEEHECPRAYVGGDQYAPEGLKSPRISREHATSRSRAMAQALTPVTVTTEADSQSSPEPVSKSLSEIDKLLAQDFGPKA